MYDGEWKDGRPAHVASSLSLVNTHVASSTDALMLTVKPNQPIRLEVETVDEAGSCVSEGMYV